MKQIFTILLTLLLMSSCTKEVVINKADPAPITFSNVFIDKATKAPQDITYGGTPAVPLEKFNIYGTVTGNKGKVNIYDGNDVTGSIGSGSWTCTKQQFWIDNCGYDFIALVDATASVTIGSDTISNTVDTDSYGMPVSVTYKTRTQKDILFAAAAKENVQPPYSPVELTFQHMLSKVMFTFINNFPDDSGVELTVTDIKIANAPATAVYSYEDSHTTGDKWDWGSRSTEVVDVNFGATGIINDNGGNGECAKVGLMVPGTYTLNVMFTIKHNKGGSDTTKNVPIEVTFEKGYAYNLTAELNLGNVEGVVPIKFNITFDPEGWDNSDTPIKY